VTLGGRTPFRGTPPALSHDTLGEIPWVKLQVGSSVRAFVFVSM
jgi:hypothetical protein